MVTLVASVPVSVGNPLATSHRYVLAAFSWQKAFGAKVRAAKKEQDAARHR